MRVPTFSFKTEPVWMLLLSLIIAIIGLVIAVVVWVMRRFV